jgi:hypothetical protein
MRSPVEQPYRGSGEAGRDIRRGDAATVFSGRKGADRDCGLRGEDSIAELCRKKGITQNLTIIGPRNF